jgi:hypothetical protein
VSSVSNGLCFLTLLLVSVTRVIYTSKGMSKKVGVRVIRSVRVIYRKIRYIVSRRGFGGMDWIDLNQDTDIWRAGTYECGNELSGSIKCGAFLH